MIIATRGGRRLLVAAGAMGLAIGAAASWGTRAEAQTPTVVQAEGDAYAVYAQASLLGQQPIHVGPVSQSLAYVPPGTTQNSAASLVNCTNSVGPSCLDPLVNGLNVLQSNADAGITPVKTHCDGAPPGFGGETITGGNACVTIASIAALNAGSPDKPQDQLFASAVTSESQMQGCGYGKAIGKTEILNLTIGGTELVGPDPGALFDVTPPANTVISVGGLITVILNEQHYDNQGHGFIVNAIHVFTSADLGSLANVDLVIGHAHSEDMCDTGTVSTPPGNPGGGGQNVPTGTKLDSTKHADPGEVVTYTLTITSNQCEVVSVTDFLPSGFQYVAGSASGDLGTSPTVTQSTSNPAIQQLDWYNPSGFLKAKLVETFKAKVPANAAPGDYVNNVAGDSSEPAGSQLGCGSFEFSDTLPVNGPIPANNGNNPGIIVPRSGGTPTPAPTATPTAAVSPVTTPISTPNTAGGSPAGWATPFGLFLLGGLAVLRRRASRRTH